MPTIFARGNRKTIQRLITLRKQAQRDRQTRVTLRIQGVILSLKKHTTVEISKLLIVHRTSVYAWITAWNELGEDGLLEGYRSGRHSRLTTQDKERLYDIVDSGPVAYGFTSGIWTSSMVTQIIENEFNITYHSGHVRKLLKQLGFSIQRPTVKLAQADPSKQRKWIRHTYPNLKKKKRKKKKQ